MMREEECSLLGLQPVYVYENSGIFELIQMPGLSANRNFDESSPEQRNFRFAG
jgi:hypothetical protein